MHAGASPAFAILRLPRGAEKPTEEKLRQALQRDRDHLSLSALNGHAELEVTGPYAIVVDGAELDEYVVWER